MDVGDTRAVAAALHGATACISSVHYTYNIDVMRFAIHAGVPMTDFGGNTGVVWKQRECDAAAARAGVTVVPDCGMGPGLNVSLATYVDDHAPSDLLQWGHGGARRSRRR